MYVISILDLTNLIIIDTGDQFAAINQITCRPCFAMSVRDASLVDLHIERTVP